MGGWQKEGGQRVWGADKLVLESEVGVGPVSRSSFSKSSFRAGLTPMDSFCIMAGGPRVKRPSVHTPCLLNPHNSSPGARRTLSHKGSGVCRQNQALMPPSYFHTSTLPHFLPRCQEDIKAQACISETKHRCLTLPHFLTSSPGARRTSRLRGTPVRAPRHPCSWEPPSAARW